MNNKLFYLLISGVITVYGAAMYRIGYKAGVRSESTRCSTQVIRNHHAKWIIYSDGTRELEFRPVSKRIGPAVVFR